MRCKVGDLAIRVSAVNGAEIPIGAIVEVKRFMGMRAPMAGGRRTNAKPCWAVAFRGLDYDPNDWCSWVVPDEDLRPIRDQPGNDETLTWSSVPKTTTRKLVKL
jgi:hypothetical protein